MCRYAFTPVSPYTPVPAYLYTCTSSYISTTYVPTNISMYLYPHLCRCHACIHVFKCLLSPPLTTTPYHYLISSSLYPCKITSNHSVSTTSPNSWQPFAHMTPTSVHAASFHSLRPKVQVGRRDQDHDFLLLGIEM